MHGACHRRSLPPAFEADRIGCFSVHSHSVRYNPSLDGIRAVAILVVMAEHAGVPWMPTGQLGVDVFFVLSGFLITRLLRDELCRTGALQLARFYARRAVRLYPTLLLMLAAAVLVGPHFWPKHDMAKEALFAALYLSDYSALLLRTPEVLVHTWSLSVEEHFYLIWALVLPWLMRQRDPARIMLRLYACFVIWRFLNMLVIGPEWAYHRFDTRLSGLALGCWLALVQLPALPRHIGWAALALVFAAGGIQSLYPLFIFLIDVFAAGLVITAVQGTGPAAALARLSYLGKLSYGLYLWHWPIFYWMRERHDWTLTLAVGGTLSFVLAAASYHLVDVPLRGLKRRLRGGGATATA